MARNEIKTAYITEGVPLVCVGRIQTASGALVTTSMVTSVALTIFNLDNGIPTTEVYSESPIDPVLLYTDTLQYDYESVMGDANGRNFLLIIDGDRYAFQGGNQYRVQIISYIGSGAHVERLNVVVGEVF